MEVKFFRMAPHLALTVLVLISGASGAEWNLTYSQLKVCALSGSTVSMNLTYTIPTNLTVKKIFWLINPVYGVESPDLRNVTAYSGRAWYSGDNQQYLSLTLSNVTKSDETAYYVRILTNDTRFRFLQMPGVTLKVTDLSVLLPARVTTGQTAVLKCFFTTCNLTDLTFIWYKDGRHLTTKVIKNNELHLQPVSKEDTGGYSCAVREYQHLPSPAQALSVQYPPENVLVTMSPSEITLGGSVTLTCSSDGYPPVDGYTWFKEGETSPVGAGQNYSIFNFTSADAGLYRCHAQNQLGAQNGTVFVPLAVRPVFLSVAVGVGVGVCGVAALLGAAFWFRRGKQKKRMTEDLNYQNVGPNAGYGMNRAVDASTQSSSELYQNAAVLRNMMYKNQP